VEAEMPRILAILPGIIPSTSILIIKPLLQLSISGRIQLKIVLESTVHQRQIEWAELIMFCRNTEPRYKSNLERILRLGIPYIYDLDDNFFELPENTELGAYHRHPDRIALLKEYLKWANLVRVYSRPMLEYIHPMNQNVQRAFGPIDFRRIDASVGEKSNSIKIVFPTSSYQNDLLSMALPALEKILQKYNGRVEAHFWGVKPTGMTPSARIHCHRFIMDYDRFLHQFSQAHYDIGLAPMRDDLFHRSKTNNKFREYGACGIAGIYSDVETYSTCVQNEITGLLVKNDTDSWYNAMARLIEDPALARNLKSQSQEYVRRHYSQELFENLLWQRIQETLDKTVRQKESQRPLKTIQPEWEAQISQSGIARKIRTWRNRMKMLDKNPVSFFFWLACRSLFVRWSLLSFRIATSPATRYFRCNRFRK
jgi:glycosyltransferase involved in cell wall biosynthesis